MGIDPSSSLVTRPLRREGSRKGTDVHKTDHHLVRGRRETVTMGPFARRRA